VLSNKFRHVFSVRDELNGAQHGALWNAAVDRQWTMMIFTSNEWMDEKGWEGEGKER